MISGIVSFDKPSGWTSFDVVNKVRNTLEKGIREETGRRTRLKVGHSGTLDPFATGLLIIAYGKCTKGIDVITKKDKDYEGVMVFDAQSTTGDIEGTIEKIKNAHDLQQSDIEHAYKAFLGAIKQIPPAHSAIKIGGKRAYELARRGEIPNLKPRDVRVHSFKLTKFKYPRAYFRARVSSGTYIRSLAMDVGKTLHTHAYLEELRRTAIHGTEVEGALDPEKATYEEILAASEKCT